MSDHQRDLRAFLDRAARRWAAEQNDSDEIGGWPPVTLPGSGARLPEDDKDPAKHEGGEDR